MTTSYKTESNIPDFLLAAVEDYLARYCFRWGNWAIHSAHLAVKSESELAAFAAKNNLDVVELKRHLDSWRARGCPRPDETDISEEGDNGCFSDH